MRSCVCSKHRRPAPSSTGSPGSYADATEESYQPGWYDLYEDGCLYRFDGSAYTGEVDCNRDGYADTTQQPNNVDTSETAEYVATQVRAVYKMWADRFRASGLSYDYTRAVIATGPVTIGCTTKDGDLLLEMDDWIFYCPTDDTVYFGPGNLEKIVQSGIATVQFTLAHELGHHIQDELDPSFWPGNYSQDTVKYENQATCMAGVWFSQLDADGTPSDINQAMTYLSTATDDIHGKAEDQIAALLQGYHDPNSC